VQPHLRKNKHMNMKCGWKLKFTFCFMKTTREPLHFGKGSLEALKYGDVATFWGWVVSNAEPLCVEFFSSVHFNPSFFSWSFLLSNVFCILEIPTRSQKITLGYNWNFISCLKGKQHIFVTKISWLMLLKEIKAITVLFWELYDTHRYSLWVKCKLTVC
jgi:hypothetical protein